MNLLIDMFYTDASTRLIANGWVILNVSRYDPTHVDGLTPSGRAFTLDIVNGNATLTVAGRVRTASIGAGWEAGDKTIDGLLAAHLALPANQR